MEDVAAVFLNGLKSVKNNKVLFVPAMILMALTMIAVVVMIAAPFLLLYLEIHWVAQIVFPCLCLLILILLTAYITAGQYGMAKEAASTGKTDYGHFWSYAKRFFGRVFMAYAVDIILVVGITLILYIPAMFLMFNTVLADPMYVFIGIFALMIAVMLISIFSILYYLFFFFVRYNIVVDDLSVIESYKKSFALLKEKPLQVLLFIFIIYIITTVFSTIFYVILMMLSFSFFAFALISEFISPVLGAIFGIIVILLAVILTIIFGAILTTLIGVWVTRFYMAITEKTLYAEEKLTGS